MNYKLLFGMELEKNKQLEDRLFMKDVKINNLQEEVKKLRKLLEEQNKKTIELEYEEPEIKYLFKDCIVYV